MVDRRVARLGEKASEEIVDVDAKSMLEMQDASQLPVASTVMLRENFTPLQALSESVGREEPSFVGYPIDTSECLSKRPYDDDPRLEEEDDYQYADPDEPSTSNNGALSSSQFDLMWPRIAQEYRDVDSTLSDKGVHVGWKERVRKLCKLTGTEAATAATIEGMGVGLFGHIRKLHLHADITENYFCHQAYTYMVAVWLVVCFHISDKASPGGRYLSQIFGSLCMSALMLMPSESVPTQPEL